MAMKKWTAETMPQEYRDALVSYAAEHGKKWKDRLWMDWYNARAIGDRGTTLHGLRNDPRFGPEALHDFKLPKKE